MASPSCSIGVLRQPAGVVEGLLESVLTERLHPVLTHQLGLHAGLCLREDPLRELRSPDAVRT